MFRFGLEPLLLQRRAVEDALRARLAAAARSCARAQHAQRELDAAFDAARAGPQRAGDLAEIEAALRVQAARIDGARIARERLRAALIDAGRARRALELLRERRLAAYRQERRRRDERDLADFVISSGAICHLERSA